MTSPPQLARQPSGIAMAWIARSSRTMTKIRKPHPCRRRRPLIPFPEEPVQPRDLAPSPLIPGTGEAGNPESRRLPICIDGTERGANPSPLAGSGDHAKRGGRGRVRRHPTRSSAALGPPSPFRGGLVQTSRLTVSIPLPEKPVQPRDLADEIVEPPVGSGELAQRPDEQPGRRRSPKEQREMRQVPALRKRACDVIHIVNPAASVARQPRLCYSSASAASFSAAAHVRASSLATLISVSATVRRCRAILSGDAFSSINFTTPPT